MKKFKEDPNDIIDGEFLEEDIQNEKFNTDEYRAFFKEDSFWDKIKDYAVKIGLKGIYFALILYYVLQKESIPLKDKTLIIGALGGNRKGEKRTLLNLLIVFLVSGIWHGAGWNFIIWGMLHGICILIHRVWKNSKRKMNKFIGWFITMNLVNIFWVFFRAKDLASAFKIIKGMFDVYDLVNINLVLKESKDFFEIVKEMTNGLGNLQNIIIIPLAFIILFFLKNSMERCRKFKNNLISYIEIVVYFCISVLFLSGMSTFLYFNF